MRTFHPGKLIWVTLLWWFTALALPAPAALIIDGITEPVFDVTLSLPVPGIIAAEHFREGDFVQTNAVILELDSRLESLDVERYELAMDNKKQDWESTKKVFEKTASVSRDELLKKESEYRIAQVEREIAVEQLARRKLTTPRDGVITEIRLHVGESCAAYQPVARVVDTRHCFFVCNAEAKAAKSVQLGQAVDLEFLDATAPIKLQGKIVFVSPVVDGASGLGRIKAIFDNMDSSIKPGMAGRMILH